MPGSVKIGPDDPILGENDLRRRTTAAEVAAATGEDGDTPIFDVWILTVSPARSPSLKVSPGDVLIEGQHVVAPAKDLREFLAICTDLDAGLRIATHIESLDPH